jgi:hypothetical protein
MIVYRDMLEKVMVAETHNIAQFTAYVDSDLQNRW